MEPSGGLTFPLKLQKSRIRKNNPFRDYSLPVSNRDTSALHLPAEGSELGANVSSVQPPEAALSPVGCLTQAGGCFCRGHCLCLGDTAATLVQTPVIGAVTLQTPGQCSSGEVLKAADM